MKPGTPAVSTKPYDLLILGGGPAGYSAAIKGALQGFRVALIEDVRIGGACINRGCIPTKALWGTALELERLKKLKNHGVTLAGKWKFNFTVAMKRQFKIIDQMVETLESRMKKLGVEIHRSRGEILASQPECQVKLKDGTVLKGRFLLVCTGSHPAETDVLKADHKYVVTTDDIVLFKNLPKTLAIVGGGVVACEFASIFNAFGVKVHLFEHSTQVLSAMDSEVVGMLMKNFSKKGMTIHTHTTVSKIKIDKKKKINPVHLELKSHDKAKKLQVDCVLLAIGRKPNIEDIGLENLDVKTTPRGHIIVNGKLETTAKNVYAAGDIVGGQMLAHKAWYDAMVAVRAMCGEEVQTNYDTVPGAIFTIPEMASVGMQPDQARQKGFKVAIGKFLYSANSQAMCIGETEGIMKAVIDRDTNKVLGFTMYGYNSSNMISEVALAMASGLTAQDIGNTIHPHPTLSEMVWESFLDTQGLAVHQ